jgi:hypothetical protein
VTAFSKQNLAMLGLAGSGEQPINPDRGRIGKGRRIGKARMTAKDIIAQDIIAQELTVFDITGDGSRFRMSFRCGGGEQGSLSLPTECLSELIMTLPRMVTQALRARHGDDSLRLVYAADNVRVEQSSDAKTAIVTLTTPDGFEVSFGLTEQQMKALVDAAGVVGRRSVDINLPTFN